MSYREASIACEFIQDRSRLETAAKLHLAPSTVNSHAERIYLKLCVHSKTQLTRMLVEEAWRQLLDER